ncbi:hypothetical protein ACFY30_18765 [Streptomyces sp. NPDC000345]|uniref:hypothetical protein n=1 Tax=Streptomyces sp. NPDC000345 TaxID=3364537 RepID=UPI00369EF753
MGEGLVAFFLQPLVLRGEIVDTGAQVSGADPVELSAETAANGVLGKSEPSR